MITDYYWRTTGEESPEEIAHAIDTAGLDQTVLFAPYIS